jgi:hypothetical protein
MTAVMSSSPGSAILGTVTAQRTASTTMGNSTNMPSPAAQRLEAFERAFLVNPHQPRIPRHIGGEDRCETTAGGHLRTVLISLREP